MRKIAVFKEIITIYKPYSRGFARKKAALPPEYLTKKSINEEDLLSKFMEKEENSELNKKLEDFMAKKEKEGLDMERMFEGLIKNTVENKPTEKDFELDRLIKNEDFRKMQEIFNKNMDSYVKDNPELSKEIENIKTQTKAQTENTQKTLKINKTQGKNIKKK